MSHLLMVFMRAEAKASAPMPNERLNLTMNLDIVCGDDRPALTMDVGPAQWRLGSLVGMQAPERGSICSAGQAQKYHQQLYDFSRR